MEEGPRLMGLTLILALNDNRPERDRTELTDDRVREESTNSQVTIKEETLIADTCNKIIDKADITLENENITDVSSDIVTSLNTIKRYIKIRKAKS